MANLNSKLEEINGVGEKTANILKRLGLNTVSDLLFYLPFRYETYNEGVDIGNLTAGENISIKAEIELIKSRRAKHRKMWLTEAIVNTGKENLKVIWFNQPFLAKTLKIGDRLILNGKINENQGQISLVSPEYEKINQLEELESTKESKKNNNLIPIYHLTEGKLSQKQLRIIIKKVLPLTRQISEWLPEEIINNLKLIPLSKALAMIHEPKNKEEIKIAKQRLAFSSLFLRQIKSQIIKNALKTKTAINIDFKEKETRNFVNSLPFKLTADQKKSAWEILKDLNKSRPMSRLLEGDVGSGKTLVAAIAMLNVSLNKKKSALMVPSEILASQHFQTISKLFKNLPINIALKTRSYKQGDFKKADIIIGTQTLIQEKNILDNLALTIVDEQHRFGVNQRKKIIDLNKSNNISPHFLSLSATPIPRSLSLAIYGDLDLSLINELPPGRKATKTKVLTEKDREKTYTFIKERINDGRQAFFVYPLISSSDKLAFKSVEDEYERISQLDFKDYKVALIHGKLKKEKKEKIMNEFSEGKIDILMATTVIEVGIDIPNATIILIEGADRFGLAQLHQLRGRVNRSDKESFCFLFSSKDNIDNKKTLSRLKALEEHNRGLELAKIDLSLRGDGEIFGSYQSGFFDLNAISLFNYETIKSSADLSAKILAKNQTLQNYPLLKAKLNGLNEDFHLE